MDTATFLETRRVFSLRDAVAALSPGQRKGALDRLQYFAKQGRVKSVAYGVYASVPAGADARRFQPDRYLVAAALRPDGVISHHAALELLGAAHSDWSTCTVLTRRRRPPVSLDGVTIQFLAPPAMLARRHRDNLGVRPVDRLGQTLRVTGPERTLVDGFWQPGLVGGLPELVESAAGFGVLDLDLLREVLKAYDQKTLFAAVGWFLERYQRTFFVSAKYLSALQKRCPKAPHYLLRAERGGVMVPRWNLIVPEPLVRGEPNEP
jgi:predicted transcriptional regulator of viral defense system